jgi:hypothetical protein
MPLRGSSELTMRPAMTKPVNAKSFLVFENEIDLMRRSRRDNAPPHIDNDRLFCCRRRPPVRQRIAMKKSPQPSITEFRPGAPL